MNLKQKPVISEILPAFFLFGLIAVAFWSELQIPALLTGPVSMLILQASTVVIAGWIFGTFFDALRNGIIEEVLDRTYRKINWDFLFKADEKKIVSFEERYYEYYTLDVNFVIAAVCFFIACVYLHWHLRIGLHSNEVAVIVLALIFSAVFIYDAKSMRDEMAHILEANIDEP